MFGDDGSGRYPTFPRNQAQDLKLPLCAGVAVRRGGPSRWFSRKHQLAEVAAEVGAEAGSAGVELTWRHERARQGVYLYAVVAQSGPASGKVVVAR